MVIILKIRNVILILLYLSGSVHAQIISTFVGNGVIGCSGYGGTAISAKIRNPLGCTFDTHGNFIFANQQCNLVCKVNLAGIMTIMAGGGSSLGDGGQATAANLNYPNDVVFDTAGNLYIADGMHYRIRKVNATTGIISTIAGTGTLGYSGDGGPATAARFYGINGLCFDRRGNLYISDAGNYCIRKISFSGIITTIAGTGSPGFSGDGGPATAAQMGIPMDVVVDTFDNIYFPDPNNMRIRKIDTSGIITTIAGTGSAGFSPDGTYAISASIFPYKLTLDKNQNFYFDDSNRIRKIDITGAIHTITGTSTPGYNGDGIRADTAQISLPSGIAIDNCQNVYFGDVGNNRIRKVTFTHTPVVFTITSNTGDTICTGMPVTYTAHTTASGTLAYQWQVNGTNVGSGAANYTYSPANGDYVKCVLIHTTPCYSDTIGSNVLHMVTNVLGVTLSGATTAPIGSPVTVNATVTGADSAYNIQWRNKNVLFSTTALPVVTYTKVMAVDSVTAKIVSASQGCNDSAVSGVHVVVGNVGVTSPQPSPKEREVLLWPNPVSGELVIENVKACDVVFYDVVGRKVASFLAMTNREKLDVSGLASGVYFVQVNGTDGFRVVQRVVKE